MMINDPQLAGCPNCHKAWGAHAKNCQYYSRPQHTFSEAEMVVMETNRVMDPMRTVTKV